MSSKSYKTRPYGNGVPEYDFNRLKKQIAKAVAHGDVIPQGEIERVAEKACKVCGKKIGVYAEAWMHMITGRGCPRCNISGRESRYYAMRKQIARRVMPALYIDEDMSTAEEYFLHYRPYVTIDKFQRTQYRFWAQAGLTVAFYRSLFLSMPKKDAVRVMQLRAESWEEDDQADWADRAEVVPCAEGE